MTALPPNQLTTKDRTAESSGGQETASDSQEQCLAANVVLKQSDQAEEAGDGQGASWTISKEVEEKVRLLNTMIQGSQDLIASECHVSLEDIENAHKELWYRYVLDKRVGTESAAEVCELYRTASEQANSTMLEQLNEVFRAVQSSLGNPPSAVSASNDTSSKEAQETSADSQVSEMALAVANKLTCLAIQCCPDRQEDTLGCTQTNLGRSWAATEDLQERIRTGEKVGQSASLYRMPTLISAVNN